MEFLTPFFLGFIAAAIGVLPPGLINMTASKVSIKEGKNRALLFVFGAIIIIIIQTLISVIFAKYINNNEIVGVFREIGFIVFFLLTIYFLFFARKPKLNSKEGPKIKSKKSRFFLGMLISAINFFPIPYYAFISITLASYKLFAFNTISIYSFVLGVVIGSLGAFYCYILFFNKLKSKTAFFLRNMNTIIGAITGIIALLTLYNILKSYL